MMTPLISLLSPYYFAQAKTEYLKKIPIINDNHCTYDASAASIKLQDRMINEVNLVRTQPKEYAKILLGNFSEKLVGNVYIKDGIQYSLQEGWKAVDEAVQFLRSVKPVAALGVSRCLSRAAGDHVLDQGSKGAVGHRGADGSQPSERAERHLGKQPAFCGENISYGFSEPRDVVMQLLVDDGVQSRAHRKNLFNPEYKSLGVAYGQHKSYKHMTVHLMCLNPI